MSSLENSSDAFLLRRLGRELALIYHDTLQAPLPAGLQALIDRLDREREPRRAAAEAAKLS